MKHDSEFGRWLFGVFLLACVSGLFGFVGCQVEHFRWDECVKTNTRNYCTMQHPFGAHR